MATELDEDIFQDIREAVSHTLEMAEAESKISDETKDLLGQLILTRRGNGDVALDIAALQRQKGGDSTWTDKERNEQNRYVNPTRLPQMIAGLSGLTAGQYLAFVQRPLERNGENGPFLLANTNRFIEAYSDKERATERNKIFGHMQRYMAKMLIDAVLAAILKTTDQAEIDKKREATPAPEQFELAARALNVSATEVMTTLFKCAVALTVLEPLKKKAIKVRKSQPQFETLLRKLGSQNSGTNAKTRLKEIFVGYQHDMEILEKEFTLLGKGFQPILKRLNKDEFDNSFNNIHLIAARLDAIATRWSIIIAEAGNLDNTRTPLDKLKGMHKVFLS